MLDRVLILSASSGAGHIRAAQALERAFLDSGCARDVRHIDALQYASPIVRDIYSKAYINMVNKAPAVLGWLYDASDKPWKNEIRRLAFDRLNTLPLIKLIIDYDPEMIVSTHFLPAELVSWLLCRKRINAGHAIVVTDLDAHAMWLCRHYDQYFVALEETKEHLRRMGVDPHHINVSGIPIDPVFAQFKSKSELRDKFGLKQDLTTIIISAGGFGVGPMEQLLAALAQMTHPVQVIAMCGKNDLLRKRLEAVSRKSSNHLLIKPLGFTTQVDEYMAAADMVLGKPGGLTTAEALSKGLIFVIVNPIPGQEERNSDHLLEEGAGIRCNNLPTLAYKLDTLLGDEERMQAMRVNALRLAHPLAALEIASKLAHLHATAHQGTICGMDHVCYTPAFAATIRAARKRLRKSELTFLRSLARPSRRLSFKAVFRSKIH
jgi:processive 1,2-diacylglycerol beta-glucosyltransferase